MTNFKCLQSIRGLALRATLLDDCGRPVNIEEVPNSQISTAAFTNLSLSPDNEDGDQIRRKRADGSWCINDNSDPSRLLGMEATLMLCDVPMALNEMLICSTLLDRPDTEGPDGFVLPSTNFTNTLDNCNRGVLLEIWSENGDNKACDENGNAFRYVRWFMPYAIRWKLNGDVTWQSDEAVEWELMGYIENNPAFDSPVGLANDPDLTPEIIQAIRDGGPLAALCTNALPEIEDCGYINPPEVLT